MLSPSVSLPARPWPVGDTSDSSFINKDLVGWRAPRVARKRPLPGVVLALVYAIFRPHLSLVQSLLGALIGAGILLLIYGAYYLLRKKEGLGLGDVTMMLMIGAFLGWRQTLFTLILASLLGALVGGFFILFRKKTLQYALPFGTFLAAAAFVSLIWGERIIAAYLSLYKT